MVVTQKERQSSNILSTCTLYCLTFFLDNHKDINWVENVNINLDFPDIYFVPSIDLQLIRFMIAVTIHFSVVKSFFFTSKLSCLSFNPFFTDIYVHMATSLILWSNIV